MAVDDPADDGELDVMGVPVSPFASYREAVERVERAVQNGDRTFCVAVNPEKIYRAWHDAGIMSLLHEADMHICDGIGAVLAVRLLHGGKLPRITGVRLFGELIRAAAERGWGVYLLGATETSNTGACEALRSQYPDLRIVGARDGYFDDSAEVVDEIRKSGADLLFVALGSPKQEQWIVEHREELPTFCMGVGGTLDVVSGEVSRAPWIFRTTGTEWLYRLCTDPKRWKRQKCYPFFMFKVLKKAIGDFFRVSPMDDRSS